MEKIGLRGFHDVYPEKYFCQHTSDDENIGWISHMVWRALLVSKINPTQNDRPLMSRTRTRRKKKEEDETNNDEDNDER